MRRVLVVTVAAGVVVLGLFTALHRNSLAFTLGVSPTVRAVTVAPRQEACQTPIDVPASFDRVALAVATFGRPGPRLIVSARDTTNRVRGTGWLRAGYRDLAARRLERVRLDRSVSAPRIALCVRNVGTRPIALYGNTRLAARASTILLDGIDQRTDMAIRFERPPRSLASELGGMAQRAALFRFPGMSPWIYLALALVLLVGGPWLLLRALRSALTWPADER